MRLPILERISDDREGHSDRTAPTREIRAPVAASKNLPALATAVAHPCDESSLSGAVEAAHSGLIVPILVGPKEKIDHLATSLGLSVEGFELVDARTAKMRRTRRLSLSVLARRNY